MTYPLAHVHFKSLDVLLGGMGVAGFHVLKAVNIHVGNVKATVEPDQDTIGQAAAHRTQTALISESMVIRFYI